MEWNKWGSDKGWMNETKLPFFLFGRLMKERNGTQLFLVWKISCGMGCNMLTHEQSLFRPSPPQFLRTKGNRFSLSLFPFPSISNSKTRGLFPFPSSPLSESEIVTFGYTTPVNQVFVLKHAFQWVYWTCTLQYNSN